MELRNKKIFTRWGIADISEPPDIRRYISGNEYVGYHAEQGCSYFIWKNNGKCFATKTDYREESK